MDSIEEIKARKIAIEQELKDLEAKEIFIEAAKIMSRGSRGLRPIPSQVGGIFMV